MMDKKFTKMEKTIYDLMRVEGLTVKEISEKLCLAKSSVLTHKNNIYIKTDSHSRAELIYKHWSKNAS